jgi:frataxin-like iron-binding protein CyaY
MRKINRTLLYLFATIILNISVANGAFAQQSNPDKKKLTGTWVFKTPDYIVVLKILENNQLVFDGETSSYILVPNAIRVFDEYGGAFDYQYTLNEGKLSVTFPDGNQYVFTKQKASPVSKMNSNSGGTYKNLYGNFCHYSILSCKRSSKLFVNFFDSRATPYSYRYM